MNCCHGNQVPMETDTFLMNQHCTTGLSLLVVFCFASFSPKKLETVLAD